MQKAFHVCQALNQSRTILPQSNVLTTKQDSVMASGDNARCCRLCGSESSLKFFRDTYIWEGVEQTYNQLLTNCFGVIVNPADCMICDTCICTLKSTERFRALVHAAFDVTASSSDLITKGSSSVVTKIPVTKSTCQANVKVFRHTSPMSRNCASVRKKPDSNNKMSGYQNEWMLSANKNFPKLKHSTCPQMRIRKINVRCHLCQQRYPMIVSSIEQQLFVCPRCKKNAENKVSTCKKNNIVMKNNPIKEHFMLHQKVDHSGKTRKSYVKKTVPPSPTIIITKQPFQCTKCPNRYNFGSQLVAHVKNAHGVCTYSEILKCRETLNPCGKHPNLMLSHKENMQCQPTPHLFKKRKCLYTRKII